MCVILPLVLQTIYLQLFPYSPIYLYYYKLLTKAAEQLTNYQQRCGPARQAKAFLRSYLNRAKWLPSPRRLRFQARVILRRVPRFAHVGHAN